MKKVLSIFLVLLLAMSSLAGCGGGSTEPTTTPDVSDDSGLCKVSAESDIVMLNYSDVSTLFPANMSSAAEGALADLVYESLCDFDDDMNIQWILAEGCDVSEDGKVYDFKLRKGIKFSGGDDWNAEAAKKNFDLILDPNSSIYISWLFEMIESVEAPDEYTFRVNLTAPYAALYSCFAAFNGFVSPTLIDKGPEAWAHEMDGTGQYVFTDYSSGEYAKFELRRDYWGYDPELCGGAALVAADCGFNSITVKPVSEEATRMAMLMSGEADIINSLTVKNIATVESAGATSFDTIGAMVGYLYYNCSKPPLNDKRVRQAITMAIDTAQLNKTVYGGMNLQCDSVIPPSISYYKAQSLIEVNLEKAKDLLAEAGYPNGFTVVAWEENDNSDIQRGQFIQQQLEQIGITVDVQPMEGATLADKIDGYSGVGDGSDIGYDLYIRGWASDTFDSDEMLGRYTTKNFPSNGTNYSFYSNEDVDRLCEIGRSSNDPEERAKVYAEVQEILWDEMPVNPLLVNGMIGAYGKRIANFRYTTAGGFDWRTAKYNNQ